jgi:DNA-binding CsgD family transcriptional regulator
MGAALTGKITGKTFLGALEKVVASAGSDAHVDRLIDLIAAMVWHDSITVVRYSVREKPEFVSYRNYSAAMVRKYLETYYVYDPFYAAWRKHQKPGVIALSGWHQARGPYVAEFLSQSVIRDELGVLLHDGAGWCLGIFLDRNRRRFTPAEVKRLQAHFGVFAALHDHDIALRRPGFKRTSQSAGPGREPAALSRQQLPDGLWPVLSPRERQLVQLILAGHPTAAIAVKLGIAAGTVKNHRRHIYQKLDITSERELFLQFIDRPAAQEPQ